MSNLGPVWEDNANYSPRRMDAKNITRDTGANIVAIATTRQLGLVCPTDTSGGLIKNVVYVCDYDEAFNRLNFVPIFGKHTHSADTPEMGGTLMDIYQANTAAVVQIDMMHINLSDWQLVTVGTGTSLTYDESTTSARAKFDTGGTGNNCITGTLGGGAVSFAARLNWQAYMDVSANNNLLFRAGVNVDRVDEAQDTARRQIGMEACDGHGTNYVIINANGNTASLVVTPTTAAVAAGVRNYKIAMIPATEVRLYEAGVSVGVSGTNVPSDSSSDGKRLFRCGIKCTTSTSRQIFFHNFKLLGDPGSNRLF